MGSYVDLGQLISSPEWRHTGSILVLRGRRLRRTMRGSDRLKAILILTIARLKNAICQ